MPVAALVGSIAAPAIGGLIGKAASGGSNDAANAMQQQILDEIRALPTPDLQKAAFQKYQQAGLLSPEMQSLTQQGDSRLSGYQTNPQLQQAQMGALSKLQSLGNGGLQPQDLAALAQAKSGVDQDVQGKSGQIMQDMQMRGQGGSGAELASKLMNAQQGATRLNQDSNNITSQASSRALQNLMNAGTLGQSMAGQQFGQASQIAAAQDAINRFNAQNRQSVNNSNTAAHNYGQQYNLQNAQNIMNQNTGLMNQQQMYNNQMAQQQYADQLQKMQIAAGQGNSIAANDRQQAANTQQMWSGIGQGVGQGMGTLGNNWDKISGGAQTQTPVADGMNYNYGQASTPQSNYNLGVGTSQQQPNYSLGNDYSQNPFPLSGYNSPQ